MFDVDYRALIGRADLLYERHVEHPVQGQPIGNGRTGTMVWTTPGAIHFQINRSDLFSVNKHHAGDYADPADYCSACAQVTLEVGGTPFANGAPDFSQRLSLHDAECTVRGGGVIARCFVAATADLSQPADLFVVEIDDERADPQPLRVTLSMWRAPEVRTGNHLAAYTFAEHSPNAEEAGGDRVTLSQQFTEGGHYCASAVTMGGDGASLDAAVSAPGRRTLLLPPASGRSTLLLSSAVSWSSDEDVEHMALEKVDAALTEGVRSLHSNHLAWWKGFWERTFVHLHSEDGLADFMERVRTLHLYYMASSSRGSFPPKWNGSIFTTDGDKRNWGAQFWVWTMEMHYYALMAADADDLSEPFFRMYANQLDACRTAAAQRWGVAGAFYPETTPFDGPVELPDALAEEFRAVFLGHRPAEALSTRLRELCRYEHHLLTQLYPLQGRTDSRVCWISHLATTACELALQAWWRYRFNGDVDWLHTTAYPLLRGTVEFYRGLAVRGEDGSLHLHGLNQHEDFWGVDDGIWDLAAIRGAAPIAIAVAEKLDTDADLRQAWQEMLDDLTPYPMGDDPQAQALTGGVLAEDLWAAARVGLVDGQQNPEDVWLAPVFPFEDWTLETRLPATDAIVQKLLDLAPRMNSILRGDDCNTAIRTPIVAVRAGRGDELPAILAAYYAAFGALENGWSLFEGHGEIENQAHSIEPLGCISFLLQEGLLQGVSPRPGQPEIISLFPAWPEHWEASFRLLTRGGFLVSSAMRKGEVESVEIESRRGETCRLRNPWGTTCTMIENGAPERELDGDILQFATVAGGLYRLFPAGRTEPAPVRIAPPAAPSPAVYQVNLPNGAAVQGVLGRGR